MLIDYHIHGMGHGERGHTMDDIEPFINVAIERGIKEIGFAEHDWFWEKIDFKMFSSLQSKFPQIKIRVGLEVDHIIGREQEIYSLVYNKPFDYILGGVHHLGKDKWMFDHPDYIDRYKYENLDEIYHEYFRTVEHAAAFGMYQILPHFDLIKVFGFRPSKPVLSFKGELFSLMKGKSVAAEINTAGLRKPVQEIYPSEELLEECFANNIPITFGSDAHCPENTGRDIRLAYEFAKKVGYRKFVTFAKKHMIINELI